MNIKLLLRNFGFNFFKGGFTIGIALTIIDLLAHDQNLINFYAAASASFFLLQLFQFSRIYNNDPALSDGFIFHTIIGNLLYFVYVVIMYLLFLAHFSSNAIIIICFLLWTIGTLIYYYIEKQHSK